MRRTGPCRDAPPAPTRRLMDHGKDQPAHGPASFTESATFRGAKPGYYFGSGEQGVG